MNRLPIVCLIAISMFSGCSAFQSPNSSLGNSGASAVSQGDWRVEARGRFINGGRVEIRVDLDVQKIGDPNQTVAAPSIVTVVGQDAVVTISGDTPGINVTCSISTVREGSRAIVTVATVISQQGRVVSRPKIVFPVE